MPVSVANNPVALHVRRETGALFGSAWTVGLLALVALAAGFSGPFGTYDVLPAPQRLLYWSVMVFGTALAGQVFGSAAQTWLGRRSWPHITTILVAALLTVLPVFGVVTSVILAFGFQPGAADLMTLLVQCAAVVTGITFLTSAFPEAAAPPHRPDAPGIMARLPIGKRERLVRLQARDHYVEVVTTHGEALVAMRFRDAIAQTAPESGVQVHRSHWVALHAVAGRCRAGDGSGVRLSDGTVVPLGRTFRPRLREKGVL